MAVVAPAAATVGVGTSTGPLFVITVVVVTAVVVTWVVVAGIVTVKVAVSAAVGVATGVTVATGATVVAVGCAWLAPGRPGKLQPANSQSKLSPPTSVLVSFKMIVLSLLNVASF